jgi:cAMP-binding proteins - catabolite gene activator and regulatory subunit of cAMP-dependent protein kinases
MKIGLIHKAIDCFQDINVVHALINSGICFITIKKYYFAIEKITKALEIEKNPAFYQLLSLALFRAGKIAEALEVFQEPEPDEALIEDERNLRTGKYFDSIFPFRVGEIESFMANKHKNAYSSRNSLNTTTETTYRSHKNRKVLRAKSKIDNKHAKQNSTNEYFYQPKTKPSLPLYDNIISSKIKMDGMIKKRHESFIKIMQNYVPDYKNEGFIQQKLETWTFDQFNFTPNKDLAKKIEKINKEINFSKEIPKTSDVTSMDDIMSKRLSKQTLKIVAEEFSKEKPQRNFQLLEDILKKLPFFSKFPHEIRRKLIESSMLKSYQSDEVIIEQGEVGDSMFVILTGSIKILKTSSDFGNINLTINSMYDGDTFGELALLSEESNDNLKRSATCVAGEISKLLAISKESYKSILLDQIQNSVISKVRFFQSLPFFVDSSEISLIPLASNINPVIYKINERIIECGQKPKGLYIIYQGRCNLY